jgi:asparagine synthase (glutamine-hydrolysing)
MSGFAIGNKTLYNNINRFSAGECVLWMRDEIYRDYYYTYIPWEIPSRNYSQLKKGLTNALLSTLRKTIDSVSGRQIVVPLSAGNDSRLIASGLKKLEYENVICFSYGRRGNYEVNTSKEVCDILGYKWIYIQDDINEKRAFFMSDVYKNYVNTFESYASVPNIQDIYEVFVLKKMSIIDNNAIIINGNSGDFISGGHIPTDLSLIEKILSPNSASWLYFLNKHYSLWSTLRTKFNDNIIITQLFKNDFERCVSKNNNSMASSVMECMECIGRQSRLVANQQRAYEFIGHEWRLPLWSEELLDFWEGVPARHKIKQKLYNDILHENDWGGVWNNIDINRKLIRPYSLWAVRMLMKILVAPFGKKIWHRIEKNMFIYWMHPSYARAITSYFNVLFDNRGQRNTNSWTADQFIKKRGFKGVESVSDAVRNKYNDSR